MATGNHYGRKPQMGLWARATIAPKHFELPPAFHQPLQASDPHGVRADFLTPMTYAPASNRLNVMPSR